MPLRAGIVGLPNVGKSSLFNALSKAGADAQNYPFCTIDPNVGVVEVPDPRLHELARIFKPQQVVPATFEFVDIAGLVKGASKGEGLGNQFLAHIREVDAIIHVVRCFEDPNVVHVHGRIDPASDIETIDTELIFADLESVERQLQRSVKAARGDKKFQPEVDLLEKIKLGLEGGVPVRAQGLSPEERALSRPFFLLTAKPVLFACNVDESDLSHASDVPAVKAVHALAAKERAEVVTMSARVEADIAQLEEEERAVFLEELGLKMTGLDRLIHRAFRLLGLITFFTAGDKQVRAWTLREGSTAPQAAGVIHTDFERGFIRAEVTSFDDMIACGGEAGARDQGKLRLEGKEYVVKDGDVCFFRFSV